MPKTSANLANPLKTAMARKLPVLAIVGRPNVGKSTLFNRLIGSRRSIVGDEPGITRDRLYGKARWNGREVEVIDTGGIIPDEKELIPAEIYRQARVALEQADVIAMVVDGRTELASPDIELARLLIRSGKPILLAVNKIDTPKLENIVEDFRRLGIRNVFPVSAEHGNGLGELLDAVLERLPPITREEDVSETTVAQPPSAVFDQAETQAGAPVPQDQKET